MMKRNHVYLLLLSLILLTSGCAVIGSGVGRTIDKEIGTAVPIPLDSLRVYETKQLVQITRMNDKEVCGYPIEVHHGDHVLLMQNWSMSPGNVRRIEWADIKQASIYVTGDDVEEAGFWAGLPFDIVLMMAFTLVGGAMLAGILVR